MQVQPLCDNRSIRIMDVVNEAHEMGLRGPMVIRFQDLLRQRVVQLNEMFRKAIKEEGYKGEYRGVFPIKVNQLREVIDEIVAAGKDYNYGIEAGSNQLKQIDSAIEEASTVLGASNTRTFVLVTLPLPELRGRLSWSTQPAVDFRVVEVAAGQARVTFGRGAPSGRVIVQAFVDAAPLGRWSFQVRGW